MKKKAKTYWSIGRKEEKYSSIKSYPKFCKSINCINMLHFNKGWCLIKINNEWYCELKQNIASGANLVPIRCEFINYTGNLRHAKELPKNTSLIKLIAAYKRFKK